MSLQPESGRRPVTLSRQLTVCTKQRVFELRGPILFITALAAFVVKAAMAYLTYGTNDVTTWQQDLAKIQTQGVAALYRDGVQFRDAAGHLWPVQVFSHPPSMIHVLRFWGLLAAHSHLPIQFWMRLSCAVADACSLLLIWRMREEVPALRFHPFLLLVIAACPISIFISGFHGNTDPIMVVFLLLSVYSIETGRSSALAGLSMGLALSIKVVPVIFVPAAMFCLPGWKFRTRFALSAGAVFCVAGLPYTAIEPFLILRQTSRYSSLPWIWSNLASSLGINKGLHTGLFIAAILLISVGMNIAGTRLSLFAQCGLLTAFFLFFAPGFSVQYLAWTVPWFAYLGPGAVIGYYLLAGTFLFVAYTYWSGGIPWYVANDFGLSPTGTLLLLVCWYAVGILLLMYVRAWRGHRPE
jgi:hypothetical protein